MVQPCWDEANDGDFEQDLNAVNTGQEANTSRNLIGKLPAETSLSKEADALNLDVDEQGFQIVTSKSTKESFKEI